MIQLINVYECACSCTCAWVIKICNFWTILIFWKITNTSIHRNVFISCPEKFLNMISAHYKRKYLCNYYYMKLWNKDELLLGHKLFGLLNSFISLTKFSTAKGQRANRLKRFNQNKKYDNINPNNLWNIHLFGFNALEGVL